MKENKPEIGKEYYFFDDGKTSPARCYKAKVVQIIPYDECDVCYNVYDFESSDGLTMISKTLKEIHKESVDNHRQSENFTVLNGASMEPGAPWLYAEETDYFVECEIPGYDDHTIWFVRTIDGGWFSLNIQSSWQSGSLDVDGSVYKKTKEFWDEEEWYGWYDEQLREKGELIE